MRNKDIKVAYLHSLKDPENKSWLKAYGVQKKINAQIKTMDSFFICEEIVLRQIDNTNFFRKVWSRLPFTAISEKWKYNCTYNNIDVIYFRKNVIDNSIVRFFKAIKQHNKKCKIILEIPTFPYDREEWKSFKDLPFKLKDRFNRNKLFKYVDLLTSYGIEGKTIFNIRSLNLINGINFDSISLKKVAFSKNNINIIAMGTFADWHGYDRLIEGLAKYINNGGKTGFKLHFVGDGVALPYYRELTDKFDLHKFVIFHGQLSGNDLDNILEVCDIGCDSLATHRKNVFLSSSLKSREYCAKGLLTMGSERIDFLDNNYPYFLKLERSDDPIDFCLIERFYTGIKNKDILAKKIRDYAFDRIDMNKTMIPVVKYILNACRKNG